MTETNHCPADPFSGPPPLTPPTPEEVTRAESDAQVLADAADAAAFSLSVPDYLRRPLAAWLDSAAREALEVGSNPDAVALARVLLDRPLQTLTRTGLALASHDELRAIVERLQTELDNLRDEAAVPGWQISNALGRVDRTLRLVDELVRGCEIDGAVASRLRESLTEVPKSRDLPSPHAGATPMCATWSTSDGGPVEFVRENRTVLARSDGTPVEVLAEHARYVGGAVRPLRPATPINVDSKER